MIRCLGRVAWIAGLISKLIVLSAFQVLSSSPVHDRLLFLFEDCLSIGFGVADCRGCVGDITFVLDGHRL